MQIKASSMGGYGYLFSNRTLHVHCSASLFQSYACNFCCSVYVESNVHLTESQIKTVKTWTKPKLWTGVPLIEVSAVKRELTALLSKRKTLPVAVFSLSDGNW